MVCLALELIGSWVVVGFSVGMEAFGWSLITYCSLQSGVFWCSRVLGLSLLPLDFSFILPVVSRLLQLYSTDINTSRLVAKRFSTVRDTQRGSQSYMKKRRGRTEIEVSRSRERGDSRGERQIYTVLCSQSVLCSPDTHRDSQNQIGKRRGREEREVF